jgi:hypothetical protein
MRLGRNPEVPKEAQRVSVPSRTYMMLARSGSGQYGAMTEIALTWNPPRHPLIQESFRGEPHGICSSRRKASQFPPPLL